VHAVTGVTGFGLLRHGWEIAERSGAHLVFDSDSLPLIDGVRDVAESGVHGGGARMGVAGHVVLETDSSALAAWPSIRNLRRLLAAVDPALVDARPAGFAAVGQVRRPRR
jgi:hypothetical protein